MVDAQQKHIEQKNQQTLETKLSGAKSIYSSHVVFDAIIKTASYNKASITTEQYLLDINTRYK